MTDRLFRLCPAMEHPMADDYCKDTPHPECAGCDEELLPALSLDPDPEEWCACGDRYVHDWERTRGQCERCLPFEKLPTRDEAAACGCWRCVTVREERQERRALKRSRLRDAAEGVVMLLIRLSHYPLRHPTMPLRGALTGKVWCPDCLKAYRARGGAKEGT